MSKHTPGPWEVFYKAKYDEWHVSIPIKQGGMTWALSDDGVRSENPEADAHLIAAAPDLLDALDELLSACELPGDHCEIAQAIPKAIAAIAKATGAQ